jgi:hypothetical protein
MASDLPNIEALIEYDGQITIENIPSVGYCAVASDENNTLAMLKRRPDDTFMELLSRLDQAIEQAD